MSWSRRHYIKSYVRSSLWIVPVAAVVLNLIVGNAIHKLDARLHLEALGFGVEGARALCNSVVTFSLSVIVFTFGSLLVAIQVASGQYTPRIIATTLLRDNIIRYTVGLFVFTFLFAIKTLNRTETVVAQLAVLITGLLGLICLAAFLFLIDYAARMLRPVSLVRRVGEEGLAVLDSVYPEKLTTDQGPAAAEQDAGPVERTIVHRTIFHRGTSAIIVAVDVERLIIEAGKAGGVIEFAPQVGDFVAVDEPLFFLHGTASSIGDHILRSCVILGSERTMEQDPLFAFRILVDIAIKALSAAINDPTTAVLAIDQLQRLLRRAGLRNLRTDQILDRAGTLRLIFRTPKWDDFVHVAFTEIRFCGVSNVQIARRLRAMILNLANSVPAERHGALRQELDLLDRMLEKFYVLPEDLALARTPDPQGLGGSTEITAARWAT
jgi:uncharacterized membrane protein